jgi:hypothetical protein
LFGVRIDRIADTNLYSAICDQVIAHTSAYEALPSFRDGGAPPGTPPELLAFNDWAAIRPAVADTIESSSFTRSDQGRWVWPDMKPRLDRCGVLIGPAAIEIRPYHTPTQLVSGYAKALQRLYMSATLGSMDDLQRRLGVRRIDRISAPPELSQGATGRRLFLLNPSDLPTMSGEVLQFVIDQGNKAGRVAWLCASHAEANTVGEVVGAFGRRVFRLAPGDDSAYDNWVASPNGHLVAAGRFDGLDLAGDICRLVVLPSVPAASTEFERFAMAYLGDATFMRHRVGQRVTQALGRANRTEDDWALYLGLDPGFATILAHPAVRRSISADAAPIIRQALETHSAGWEKTRAAAGAFWAGEAMPEVATSRRPGRAVSGAHGAASADAEVAASTGLWLGDTDTASRRSREASDLLNEAGESEHGAFWRYVEAHAHYLQGSDIELGRAKQAIAEAIENGPHTAWFVRLRRTLDELEGRIAMVASQDELFLAWDEWIRQGGDSIEAKLGRARADLQGKHDQQVEGLATLARLCGATAEQPNGTSATDAIWSWISRAGTERRVWEVKTGPLERVPRKDINQVLGQLAVEAQRFPNTKTFACLLTPAPAVETDAAEAAREKIAIINIEAVLVLFDFLADRFRDYMRLWSSGTAAQRGAARAAVEPKLPHKGWLGRLLAPTGGHCRQRDAVEAEFSGRDRAG